MELHAYVTSLDTPASTVLGDVSTSRSLPCLPSKFHKRSVSKIVFRGKATLPEVEEVEQLAEWATAKDELNDHKRQSVGNEIPAALRARFADFEHCLTQRKSKASLPMLTSTAMLSLDLAHRRSDKLISDQEFRERLRYTKRYEEELQNIEREIVAKLLDLKSQREKYRKTNTFLRTQLQNAELSTKQEAATLGDIPREFKHLFKSTTLKPRDFARPPMAKAYSSLHDQSASVELKEKREKALAEIFQNTRHAKELDAFVKKTRHELRTIRNSQVQHYFSILKEGKDSRNEGLSWIVKALWRLSQKTPKDRFPEFLDGQTIDTILSVAELSLEQDEIRSKLAEIEKETKGGLIFAQSHSDKWNGVYERIQGLTKTIKVMSKNASVVSSPKAGREMERFQIETMMDESRSKRLEARLKQLEDAISSLKSSEQHRILFECCFNKLEKRLNATMKQMLSALLGTEIVHRQMSVLSKEHQSLLETMERTKTYRFGFHRKVESTQFIP